MFSSDDYRWRLRFVLPATALLSICTLGPLFALSVLIDPVRLTHPTWPAAVVSQSISIQGAMGGVFPFFVGADLQKRGLKFYGVLGSFVMLVGGLLAAVAVSTSQAWLVYVGLGFIQGSGYGVVYIATLQHLMKWFPDRPGTVAGFFGALIGVGAMIFSSLNYYMSRGIGSGWTLFSLSLISLAGALPVSFFFRFPSPSSSNLHNHLTSPSSSMSVHKEDNENDSHQNGDGGRRRSLSESRPDAEDRALEPPTSPVVPLKSLSRREILKTRQFWLICAVVFCNLAPGWGLVSVYADMFRRTSGCTLEQAANYTVLVNAFYTSGRAVWGMISDRIGNRRAYYIFLIGQASLFLIAPFLLKVGFGIFLACICVAVTLYGGSKVLLAPAIAEYLGPSNANAATGMSLLAISCAAIVGPSVATGVVSARAASYAYGVPHPEVYTAFFFTMAGFTALGVCFLIPLKKLAPEKSDTNGVFLELQDRGGASDRESVNGDGLHSEAIHKPKQQPGKGYYLSQKLAAGVVILVVSLAAAALLCLALLLGSTSTAVPALTSPTSDGCDVLIRNGVSPSPLSAQASSFTFWGTYRLTGQFDSHPFYIRDLNSTTVAALGVGEEGLYLFWWSDVSGWAIGKNLGGVPPSPSAGGEEENGVVAFVVNPAPNPTAIANEARWMAIQTNKDKDNDNSYAALDLHITCIEKGSSPPAQLRSAAGDWRYRSYFNLPLDGVTPDQLVFARGNFHLEAGPGGTLTGTLSGGDRNSAGSFWHLNVSGYERTSQWLGQPSTEIFLVAYGINGTMSEGWQYEYKASMVPTWPGENQPVDVWVGTVMRVCCHEPKGLVASLASTRAYNPPPPPPLVRKNFLHLTPLEQRRWIAAVKALKEEKDALGWSTYDYFVTRHSKNTDYAHRGPAFFPWHRQFLRTFEKELQRVGGVGMTIPYWDWSDEATRMNIWTPDLMGGNGTGPNSEVEDGPFTNWPVVNGSGTLTTNQLRRAWGTPLGAGMHIWANNTIPPVLPPLSDLISAMQVPLYDAPPYSDASHEPPSFRNIFEGWQPTGCALHNTVHLWVGGEMRLVAISPNDPVFWLHHSFVDKIWSIWQARYGGPVTRGYLPVLGAAKGHNLHDIMVPFTVTPADVLDTQALGYVYESDLLDKLLQ